MKTGVSYFSLTKKSPLELIFPTPPYALCWDVYCGAGSSGGAWEVRAVCKHAVGSLDGFTVSTSSPLGLQPFTSGWGSLPLTWCRSPRNQFNTNDGCRWEQGRASGSLQMWLGSLRMQWEHTEGQHPRLCPTFQHCRPRAGGWKLVAKPQSSGLDTGGFPGCNESFN